MGPLLMLHDQRIGREFLREISGIATVMKLHTYKPTLFVVKSQFTSLLERAVRSLKAKFDFTLMLLGDA